MKENSMKLCVIGAFGFDMLDQATGGQPVKTRQLYYALSRCYGEENVAYIETYGWKKHSFRLLRNTLRQAKCCDAMIMLPAHRGLQVFARLLAYCKKRYKIKIFYDVIGGWLPKKTAASAALAKCLQEFNGIWVETQSMLEALQTQGFQNAAVIPNFREMKVLEESELVCHGEYPLPLCTFSRVMKEKGIETAVEAVKAVNALCGHTAYRLDIYGPVAAEQAVWFDELQAGFPDYIHYCGCVTPDKSVETVKNYFALLFPTYYEGEGLAGTLIDAFSAGVPVIASDWKYNKEFVTENTGFLFPPQDVQQLTNVLAKIKEDPQLVFNKKYKCLQEASKYQADTCIAKINRQLNESQ